ncbi:uncharacterized protein [Primulina eburnea]|uniref:uncharacterized protein n=1 Tax=Primulina eburnea TaxID=1245227 RepID=UPI003C6C0953
MPDSLPTPVPVNGNFSRISPDRPHLSPPPPSRPVYLNFFPNLSSPIYSPQPPPSLSLPVCQQFFRTATLISPRVLPPQPSSSAPPPPPSLSQEPSGNGDGHPGPPRSRRNPSQLPRGGKSLEIAPPYPWATNRRATVHSLQHLLSIQIHIITGEVQCKRCERNYEMGFDLRQKLLEIFPFIIANKSQMCDRAPAAWMNPALPPCRFCKEENCVKPIVSDKKKTVNWLFLLLGQMLGFCTLGQLKYFCKHTKKHRTGAKDRVLYLTYLGLCKQLDPDGPFDR